VAEVPKHLLEKAAARRAALSGAPAPEKAASAAPTTESTAVATTAASTAVASAASPAAPAKGGGGGGSVALPTIPAGPPPLPRGSRFATVTSVFMLVAVPLWALFMFNAWATPIQTTETPEVIGAKAYATCTACHNANGSGSAGGGSGRPLWNAEVEKTFPDPLDQAAFLYHGSCSVGAPYGAADREGGQHKGKGGMPAWAGALTPQQVLYVVTYERHILKDGGKWPTDLFAKYDPKTGKEEAPDAKRAATPIDFVALDKELVKRAATLCGK
jgi:mono/diheme cytochrome c family protein